MSARRERREERGGRLCGAGAFVAKLSRVTPGGRPEEDNADRVAAAARPECGLPGWVGEGVRGWRGGAAPPSALLAGQRQWPGGLDTPSQALHPAGLRAWGPRNKAGLALALVLCELWSRSPEGRGQTRLHVLELWTPPCGHREGTAAPASAWLPTSWARLLPHSGVSEGLSNVRGTRRSAEP